MLILCNVPTRMNKFITAFWKPFTLHALPQWNSIEPAHRLCTAFTSLCVVSTTKLCAISTQNKILTTISVLKFIALIPCLESHISSRHRRTRQGGGGGARGLHTPPPKVFQNAIFGQKRMSFSGKTTWYSGKQWIIKYSGKTHQPPPPPWKKLVPYAYAYRPTCNFVTLYDMKIGGITMGIKCEWRIGDHFLVLFSSGP